MDGKITLDRQRLKSLRRNLGISQEQLAFQCAERSLCVSVASVKRAETSKNILYRTARDIALFYQISVNELIAEEDTAPEAHSPDYITQRHIILLRCCWADEADAKITIAHLRPQLSALTEQYRARDINCHPAEFWFAFGSDDVRGTEALQASNFALHLHQLCAQSNLFAPLCLLAGVALESNQNVSQTCQFPHHLLTTSVEILFEHLTYNQIIIDTQLLPQLQNSFQTEAIAHPVLAPIWTLSTQEKNWRSSLALVGRRIELLQFRAILDSSVSFDSPHVICLNGVAGIGKSRLLNEFQSLAEAEGLATHLLAMLDFGDQQSHQLVPQLMRALLGFSNQQQPSAKARLQIEQYINDIEQLPIALTMLGWPLSEAQNLILNATDHSVLIERQIQLAIRLLKLQSNQKPQLIMIEDMHWADDKSRQFLLELLLQLHELPVILLLTYRPEAAFDSSILNNNVTLALTTINLTPLNAEASTQMADQFDKLKPEYRLYCIQKSQGNPLFLEYLLRDNAQTHHDQLPFSLQALVLSRLGQLKDEDRQAMLGAAALGQRFSLQILSAVLDQPDYDPQALIDQFLITRIGDTCQFNHALIHDGVYQSIVEKDCQQLHLCCANAYINRNLVQAVKHLHRARSQEIATHLIPAITLAANNFQYETALELIEIGRHIDYVEIKQFSLYLWQAEILVKLGRISQSVTAAREAEQKSANAEQTIQSLLLQANGLNTLDDFSAAIACIDAAEQIAKAHRLLAHLARIYCLKGNFYFPRSDVQTCFKYQQKSLSYATKTGEPSLLANALGGLGDAAYAQGKMYSAYDYFSRCLTLCDEHKLPDIEAANLFMLATVRIYQNQHQQALQDALRSIELVQRLGNKRAEVVARLTAGWIYLDDVQLTAAAHQIDQGISLANDIGAKRFIPFLEESQARLLFQQGQKQAAQTLIANAIDEVEKLQANSFIGPWLLGTQALLSDDITVSEKALNKACELLAKGCIGHNYFRFHVAAMEFGLIRNRPDIVIKHRKALQKFTLEEPTPWSAFYLDRANFLLQHLAGESTTELDRQNLLQRATKAGLQSATSLLHAASISANKATPT